MGLLPKLPSSKEWNKSKCNQRTLDKFLVKKTIAMLVAQRPKNEDLYWNHCLEFNDYD